MQKKLRNLINYKLKYFVFSPEQIYLRSITLLMNFFFNSKYTVYLFDKYRFLRRNFYLKKNKIFPFFNFYCINKGYSDREMDEYHKSLKKINLKITNKFDQYKKLILDLKNSNLITILPISKILTKSKKNRINISLRHDIDSCIKTAKKMAFFLNENKIFGSFYILNTSQYFGKWINPYNSNFIFKRVYERNRELINYLDFSNLKYTELGIHIDYFTFCHSLKVNYLKVLEEDIKWFKNNNITISSTFSSHNSYLSNNIEGFEIFNEFNFRDKNYFSFEDFKYGISLFSKNYFNLKTEVNFPIKTKKIKKTKIKNFKIRNLEFLKEYFLNNKVFERSYNYSFWVNGKNSCIFSDNINKKLKIINISKIKKQIFKLPNSSKVILNLHPEYFQNE